MSARKVPAAQPDDWKHAMAGIDFPAAKVAIIRQVQDKGGIDHEVFDILNRLPRDEYQTVDDLSADLRTTYVEDGFDPNALPV